MIAHIVLFTPKESLSKEELVAFAGSMSECLRAIDQIDRASVGRRIDVNPGYSRNMGDSAYQYAAVIEFRDREALVAYLNHPRHHELGKRFWESCERTVVTEVEFGDGRDSRIADFLAS